MKKKFNYFPVVLLVIAVLAFSFIACDEDEEIERCLFNDNDKGHLHLGIGEDKCHAAAGCDLQVYGQFEDKDDNAIKIYRVGPISDFGTNSIETVAQNVINGYNVMVDNSEQEGIDFAGKVDYIYIYPSGIFTESFYVDLKNNETLVLFPGTRTQNQARLTLRNIANEDITAGNLIATLPAELQTLIKKHFGIE